MIATVPIPLRLVPARAHPFGGYQTAEAPLAIDAVVIEREQKGMIVTFQCCFLASKIGGRGYSSTGLMVQFA